MTAPGWTDFDHGVVCALRRGELDVVDKSEGGGMHCPLLGHDHWLAWDAGGYKKGTERHGEPPLSFRVSPTYILENPLDNFIAGCDLVAEALEPGNEWGKAETFRLGYENSEDAVSWNVFRSLQEAGALRVAARVLGGVDFPSEPVLMLWGRRLDLTRTAATPEIQQALTKLEQGFAQQTEPDVVLHLPGSGWIFIEAKVTSPTSTYAAKPERLKAWISRYADSAPGLFHADALAAANPKGFPEQLLRNVAVANAVRQGDEWAVVVALVRETYLGAVEEWGTAYVAPDNGVSTAAATWEGLYGALPTDERLEALRRYMEQKSVGLRPAFDLQHGVAPIA